MYRVLININAWLHQGSFHGFREILISQSAGKLLHKELQVAKKDVLACYNTLFRT